MIAIDWERPWMEPLRPFASLLDAADRRTALNDAARERGLYTAAGLPVSFVAEDDAGAGDRQRAYETHIAETGRVPTRENLHDLFNALVWLAFPRTKAALNSVQAAVIAREGVTGRRGPVRDAATLIDESGLLLVSPDPEVFASLAAHDWHGLLVDRRSRWGVDIVPVIFGHALFEKLIDPFMSITAAVMPLPMDLGRGGPDPAAVDSAAAAFVLRPDLAPASLLRLPVLGVPGWDPENADSRFYADPDVFRPAPVRNRS